MKKVLLTVGVMASLFLVQVGSYAQSNTVKSEITTAVLAEKSAIEKLIFSYQDALNASNADKVISLFTNNGVLIANAAPTSDGAAQVKGTYEYVFDNFAFNLKFNIIEIQVNGNTAFARSTSKGSLIIKSSGQTVPDENRELFVFEKTDGQWKIARYMYNKTK